MKISEKSIIRAGLWIAFISFVGIIIYGWIFWKSGYINTSRPIAPKIGSEFGALVGGLFGSLFSLAAVFLVWATYRVQKKELSQTTDALKLQQFENTFFQLLAEQRAIKENLEFDTSEAITNIVGQEFASIKLRGEQFFQFAKSDFDRLYIKRPGLITPNIHEKLSELEQLPGAAEPSGYTTPMNQPKARIRGRYKKFFDTYHHQMGHYFRHLFHLLQFLKQTELSEIKVEGRPENVVISEFRFYADVAQSQMSSSELYFMFYNGLCFPKAKELIEHYQFVENLALEDLADSETHRELYDGIQLKSRYNIIPDEEAGEEAEGD